MKSDEKIYRVLKRIKEKTEISPSDAVVNYTAGFEVNALSMEDEIMILNKLADQEIIEVINNFSF